MGRRREFELSSGLERATFEAYVNNLAERAKEGFKPIDFEYINAARAHFPEWRTSKIYHELALACAKTARENACSPVLSSAHRPWFQCPGARHTGTCHGGPTEWLHL